MVNDISIRNVYIEYGTGAIDLYLAAVDSSLKIGDLIMATDTRAAYNNLQELAAASGDYKIVSSGNAQRLSNVTVAGLLADTASYNHRCGRVKLSGVTLGAVNTSGNTARTVIATDDFSAAGIYDAIYERSVYSTEDKNLEIWYYLNDYMMGSARKIEDSSVNITASVADPGGDIAVTAPVWTSDVLKIGITSLTSDAVVPVKVGRQTMTVVIYAKLDGVDYVFTSDLEPDVLAPSELLNIALDAGHSNFYVSGIHADSDANFIELCAKNGVRCHRITDDISYEAIKDMELAALTVPFKSFGTELGAPKAPNEKASVITNGILLSIEIDFWSECNYRT